MPAPLVAGMAAAAPIIAGIGSFFGQESANQSNEAIARRTNRFNAQQAELARIYNTSEATTARSFNHRQADIARKFEERMSSSAHQRQVMDLEKAGLNPLLSATGGASSPGGSSASAGAASGPSASGVTAKMENTLSGAIASAMEAKRLGLEMAKNKEELSNMKKMGVQIDATTTKTHADTLKSQMERKVMSKTLPEADLKNKVYETFSPSIDKILNFLKSTPAETWNKDWKQPPIKMRNN